MIVRMKDARYTQLANVLVSHSCQVTAGDNVLVEAFDTPPEFTGELIRAIAAAGGRPMVSTYQQGVLRALYNAATEEQMRAIGRIERERMEQSQCYIGVRGSHNIAEMSDVPKDKMDLYERLWWKPVHTEVRVPKTRWVVLRWPHPSMAQAANMSTEAFEDFYFDVCTMDYERMARAMVPLEQRMKKVDHVHIKGPGTDLNFSIKGIGARACNGLRNIPDGEVFSCPVKDSVNGEICFNTPTIYSGTKFENVRLVFRDGKVVEATGSNTKRLNEILDTDAGARYVGEFALGFNPFIEN